MRSDKEAASDGIDILQIAAFKAIGEAHIANLIDDLEVASDEADNVQLSQSMEEWSKGFIARKRGRRNRSARLNTRKAAIFLLILLGAFSVTTLSVEAIRVRLFEYIIETQEKFTRIYRTDDHSMLSDPELDINDYYYPTIVPKGYTFKSYNKEADILSMYYSNGTDEIIFVQFETAGDWNFDTEDAEIIEVPINDYPGYLILKGERSMLFWHNDRNEFLIRGLISADDILRIAESMKEKK